MPTKFLKAAKADSQYKRYRRILKQVQERVDIEATKKEALSLHATRTSRNLVGKNAYSTKRLLDAIAKDLSYRARLVEMRQQHSAQISLLSEAIKALHGFLGTTYRDYMRGFTNQQARSDALSTVTDRGETWIGRPVL